MSTGHMAHRERCELPTEPAGCTPCGATGVSTAKTLHDARAMTVEPCVDCEGTGAVCPVDGGPLLYGTDNDGNRYPSCIACSWVGAP